jgi:hypothetical protein
VKEGKYGRGNVADGSFFSTFDPDAQDKNQEIGNHQIEQKW